MKLRIIIPIVFMVLFLTLGVCSASALNDTDIIASDANGSFGELQNLIDNASENSIISLNKDYVHEDSEEFPEGVEINKALTIDGNNHVLDACGKSRIFYISIAMSNVVLKNIVFVNGKTDEWGGAVYIHDGEIINCTFINNSAYFGGAVEAVYGTLTGLTCLGNTAERGGALSTYNTSVYDSYFKDNAASLGGAIEQGNGNVYNSIFINNSAEYGGAIRQYFIDNNDSNDQNTSNVYSSLFINNTAELGGAIYQENSHVYDSSFVNNTASEHGGAIFEIDSTVSNSSFENNRAGEGCDDICDYYNHTDDNSTSENITYTNDGPSDESVIAEASAREDDALAKSIGSETKTGNPLVLLILALIIPIVRIRKF